MRIRQCLTCPVFVTTAGFLPQHRRQLEHTQELIARADRHGQQRLAEMNRTVQTNLLAIIDASPHRTAAATKETRAPATETTARMRVENAQRLTEHARQRHHDTLHRAEEMLIQLADTGEPVTVALLANRAGVSRSWIYTQPELREQIRQLQQRVSSHHVQDTVTRASDESLRRRLTLAHERITELRSENQQLRDALAHAHGQLRTARQHTGSQKSKTPVHDANSLLSDPFQTQRSR